MNKWILTQNGELVNLNHIVKFYISEKTCSIYGITGQKNEDGRNVSIKIISSVPDDINLTNDNKGFYEMKCGMLLETIIKFLDNDRLLLDMSQITDMVN